MPVLKGPEIEDALAGRGRHAIYLVYGPDAGLVSERARALVDATLKGDDDPLSRLRLDGDALAADPLRLADEANTRPLFGGRRAIHVRMGSKAIHAALAPLLAVPPLDSVVVVEAGDLKKTAPLRSACEKGPAGVIPCYGDDAAALGRLVENEFRAANRRLTDDARRALLARLGADRLANRGEIEKLILSAEPGGEVGLEAVEALVADTAEEEAQALVDAAFEGGPVRVARAFPHWFRQGDGVSGLLNLVGRHAATLLKLRSEVERGASARTVAERSTAFFRRKDTMARQLEAWSSAELLRAIADVNAATLQARRNGALEAEIAERLLMNLASVARR